MVKNSISYKDLTIFMFLSKQNINNTKLEFKHQLFISYTNR